MFKATGNKVVLSNNNGFKVVPVYMFEDKPYAKDGAYYRELKEGGKVQYVGKYTWYKYYNIGGTQISMFGEDLG